MRDVSRQLSAFSLVLSVMTAPLSSQSKSARWVTDTLAPCTGLTVGWWVDAPKLQALVGTRGTVAPRADGKGLVLLFATTCPHSTIDGTNTGPVALGAAIIRLQPRVDSTKPADLRWSSTPFAYGPAAAPVTEMFKLYGFATATGPVILQADSSGGVRRARFVIETADGKVEASATLGDSTAHFALRGALLSGGPDGTFGGPEWANRRFGTATVQATGATLLSRLGITTPPDLATFDTGFGWTFTFSHDR
ncbi:MAG TPA: hypothetical protein VNX15_13160 [Gemmatimonadales bacterium]|nr:hypothetical protein [Gemmatimonadales bacterium]